MAQCSFAKRGMIYVLALSGLAGCSSINSMLEPDRIDYKSDANVKKLPTLEVPPDLTQLQRENRYALPDSNNGTVTASSYNSQQKVLPVEQAAAIAPNAVADIRIERDGSQRWLVVNKTPEVLWPLIKDFWQENGFLISVDMPQAGVMETDWAENRAKIPKDFLRETLGKVFDSLYSTGERDKFRTRLERDANGSTEIYISHRGAEEVLTGQDKETSIWTARPSDPGLEAEFLSRLMVRLGADSARAKAEVASGAALPSRAKLVKGTGGGSYVQVDEGFDRAWRRVGLALDRVGFTVEDRDRSKGLYFVRYVDQDDAQTTEKKGFFSGLFSSKKDKEKTAVGYRVSVKGAADSSQITVLNNDGKQEISKTGDKILTLLNEQLK